MIRALKDGLNTYRQTESLNRLAHGIMCSAVWRMRNNSGSTLIVGCRGATSRNDLWRKFLAETDMKKRRMLRVDDEIKRLEGWLNSWSEKGEKWLASYYRRRLRALRRERAGVKTKE
jgi:hypothetical protein